MNGTIQIDIIAQNLNLTNEDLTKYDTDKDGMLSEQELQTAMGFQRELKKRIKRNEW